jgi:dTDP-glucose pyrophosphorylase
MTTYDIRLLERIIAPDDTILGALKRMDTIYQKLLIILDGEDFAGLVSIGDIQRAIIRNVSLDSPVVKIIRQNPRIATLGTGIELIKKQMLEFRMELIPVLDDNNKLALVYFWEDFFGDEKKDILSDLKATVVIMAGGRGSRLKPLTNVIPKPLIPLGEKPIIEHIIDNFMKVGSRHFIISIKYRADLIRFHFKELNIESANIEFIEEAEPFGTAGSLKLLEGKVTGTFFVTNCDILVDQDYRDIWDYHKDEKNELTLVSSLKSYDIPYGTLKVGNAGKLIEIDEKPTINYFVNAGMYVIEPHLLNEIPENKYFNITDLIEIIQKRKGKIGVFPVSEGSLKDIGNWDNYLMFLKYLK